MIHLSPNNAKPRVCQSQVRYLHATHLGSLNGAVITQATSVDKVGLTGSEFKGIL